MKIVAQKACKLLRGIVCTYKPPDCSTKYVISKLKKNICRDLNDLDASAAEECFDKEKYLNELEYLDKEKYWNEEKYLEKEEFSNKVANVEGEEYSEGIKEGYLNSDSFATELPENLKPNYADNVLCAGPRYQGKHVDVYVPKDLGDLASGVLIVSVNGGNAFSQLLKKLSFTRCYHLKGILGQVTKNFHVSEKVLVKAKYNHVTREKFELLLASYQSAAQKRVFAEYGKSLQSQEGYNFAVQCLQRPNWNGPPVLYSAKIVDFEPPDFTIEVHCANETQEYLLSMIHYLGVSLKSYATCSGIRCIRQGCFHIEHALVKQQWNLVEVLGNMSMCWRLLKENYPKKRNNLKIVTFNSSDKKFLNQMI